MLGDRSTPGSFCDHFNKMFGDVGCLSFSYETIAMMIITTTSILITTLTNDFTPCDHGNELLKWCMLTLCLNIFCMILTLTCIRDMCRSRYNDERDIVECFFCYYMIVAGALNLYGLVMVVRAFSSRDCIAKDPLLFYVAVVSIFEFVVKAVFILGSVAWSCVKPVSDGSYPVAEVDDV